MKSLALILAGWMGCAQIAAADGATDPFTGFYGGGQLGYLWLDGGSGAPLDDGVAAGGIHLGYATEWSGAVVGVELEVDTQNRLFSGDNEVVKGLARLKLRAGRVNRGVHTYGFAGFSAIDTTLGDGAGLSLGLGVAIPLTDRWQVGAELVHDRFTDIGASGTDLSLSSVNFRATYRF